jgi:hypothetical protein
LFLSPQIADVEDQFEPERIEFCRTRHIESRFPCGEEGIQRAGLDTGKPLGLFNIALLNSRNECVKVDIPPHIIHGLQEGRSQRGPDPLNEGINLGAGRWHQ